MAYFKNTGIKDGPSKWVAYVDSIGALKTAEANRLAGNNFGGPSFDTMIWTSTLTGSGTLTQAANIVTQTTGTTANSASSFVSNRVARFNFGAISVYRGVHRFVTAGTANNVRQFGAYNSSTGDGFLFRLSGSTFQIVTANTGVETVVNSGSFNGDGSGSGGSFTVDANAHSYTIRFTVGGADFLIDEVIVHTIIATTSLPSGKLTLPIYVSNTNSGGSTTNVTMETWAAIIFRMGAVYNNPLSARINGAGTYTIKNSAGLLNYVVMGDPSTNGTITFYDNTAGSGTVMLTLTTSNTNVQPSNISVDIQFNIAMTIVVTGALDFVVSYE